MKHLRTVSNTLPIKGDTSAKMMGKLGMPFMMLDSNHVNSMITYMEQKTGQTPIA